MSPKTMNTVRARKMQSLNGRIPNQKPKQTTKNQKVRTSGMIGMLKLI